ncbi:MAG TPA: hypothetical protein VN193_02820 [Candidatus Angelobacter sp.]|jgi:hypothetical protein|nr:hypothetical protein [Candidatus Angelobacter sp.]
MRAWHRELVDVWVAAVPQPMNPGDDPENEIEWYRREQAVRQERARSHVDWHDALWRVVSRLVGVSAEHKPLLVREAEATDRTASLRDDEVARRRHEFDTWLTGLGGPAG